MLNVAKKKQVVADKFDEISNDVSDSLDLLFDVLKKTPNDEIAKGYLEAFSIGNFRNYEDLDKYMRTRLKFGEEGKASIMLKQLQDVMTNSILSGPKTVVRAILVLVLLSSYVLWLRL